MVQDSLQGWPNCKVPHQEKDNKPQIIKIGVPKSIGSNDTTSYKNGWRVRSWVQNLQYVYVQQQQSLSPKTLVSATDAQQTNQTNATNEHQLFLHFFL
jgi:hypothetical protein